MPELILPQSIRGLARAFGFPGGRTGPRGVDLSIDPQTVVDLSRFAAYGAARRPELGDGWLSFSVDLAMAAGAGYYYTSQTINDSLLSNMQAGDVLWIYDTSVWIEAAVAIADFAFIAVALNATENSKVGSGTVWTEMLFTGTSSDQLLWTATASIPRNTITTKRLPTAAPQGSSLQIAANLGGAAGAVTASITVKGRIYPAGIAPLP